MGPRVWLAVCAWKPARDGATWAEIDAAWLTLAALLEAANLLDMESAS